MPNKPKRKQVKRLKSIAELFFDGKEVDQLKDYRDLFKDGTGKLFFEDLRDIFIKLGKKYRIDMENIGDQLMNGADVEQLRVQASMNRGYIAALEYMIYLIEVEIPENINEREGS